MCRGEEWLLFSNGSLAEKQLMGAHETVVDDETNKGRTRKRISGPVDEHNDLAHTLAMHAAPQAFFSGWTAYIFFKKKNSSKNSYALTKVKIHHHRYFVGRRVSGRKSSKGSFPDSWCVLVAPL
jgi:hypothetical protein